MEVGITPASARRSAPCSSVTTGSDRVSTSLRWLAGAGQLQDDPRPPVMGPPDDLLIDERVISQHHHIVAVQLVHRG